MTPFFIMSVVKLPLSSSFYLYWLAECHAIEPFASWWINKDLEKRVFLFFPQVCFSSCIITNGSNASLWRSFLQSLGNLSIPFAANNISTSFFGVETSFFCFPCILLDIWVVFRRKRIWDKPKTIVHIIIDSPARVESESNICPSIRLSLSLSCVLWTG